MAIIGNRKTWKISNQKTRAQRGPLLRVRHPDGHITHMYEADAIEAGLLPAKAKMKTTPANKMAPAPDDKAPAPAPAPVEAVPDDFTTISGVGRASARSLAAQGITTFSQLRTADLGRLSLSKAVVAAIEEWRGG